MKKSKEKRHPKSCWNKAGKNERMFVLLERDRATPSTIRFWASERIRLGLNTATDNQIESALKEAAKMEAKQKEKQGGAAKEQNPA